MTNRSQFGSTEVQQTRGEILKELKQLLKQFVMKARVVRSVDLDMTSILSLKWTEEIDHDRETVQSLMQEIQRVLDETRSQLRLVKKDEDEEILSVYLQQTSEIGLEVLLRWILHVLKTNHPFMEMVTKVIKNPLKSATAKPAHEETSIRELLEEGSEESDEYVVKQGNKRSTKVRTVRSKRRRIQNESESEESDSDSDSDIESEESDGDSGSEEDEWDDKCSVCGKRGRLICCDGCPSSFHLACAHLKVNLMRIIEM